MFCTSSTRQVTGQSPDRQVSTIPRTQAGVRIGIMITIERAKLSDVDEIKEVLRSTWDSIYADSLSHDTVERITSNWHSKEALSFQM